MYKQIAIKFTTLVFRINFFFETFEKKKNNETISNSSGITINEIK